VLFVGSLASRGAVAVIFPLTTLGIKELMDSAAWAGVGGAMTTVGAAGSAAALAAFMSRRGRNPGLSVGLAVALLGALVAAIGFEQRSLFVFLLGLLFVGVGRGTSELMRYAAADLAPEERRGRDISWIVFAATFGSVGGPLLLGVSATVAVSLGLNELTGGMVFSMGLFALAALVIWVFMRPDPLRVAGQIVSKEQSSKAVPFTAAIRIAWRGRSSRLALVALIVAQAVMVLVMTMTPVHMEVHGHPVSAVGFVLAAHTAGMFAFSPLAGWLSDRIGRIPVILAGAVVLALSTVFTVFASEAPALLMYPGLYLLGLGWSFAMVAASALLTESVSVEDRVSVQGAVDVGMNLASGVSSVAAGLVFEMTGFHVLSLVGFVAALGLMTMGRFNLRIDRVQALAP
jgi:MFS family permease